MKTLVVYYVELEQNDCLVYEKSKKKCLSNINIHDFAILLRLLGRPKYPLILSLNKRILFSLSNYFNPCNILPSFLISNPNIKFQLNSNLVKKMDNKKIYLK